MIRLLNVIFRPFDPKFWILFRTSCFALDPSPIIIITDDTPIIIPFTCVFCNHGKIRLTIDYVFVFDYYRCKFDFRFNDILKSGKQATPYHSGNYSQNFIQRCNKNMPLLSHIKNLPNLIEKKSVFSECMVFSSLLFTGIICKTTFLFFGNEWGNDFDCYLQGGSIIANGGIFYHDFGDIKPPLIYFIIAALLKLFGYNAIFVAWKMFVLAMQTSAAWVFFKTGEHLKNRSTGFAMALLFIAAITVEYHLWDYGMLLPVLPVSLSFYFFIKSGEYSIFNQFMSGLCLGIGFLGATNLGILVFLFPVVFFMIRKKITDAIVKSVPVGIGFLLPVFIVLFYFYHNNALSDMYWWTVKWAAMYNATTLNPVIAVFARIGRMFQTFVAAWDWLPLFIVVAIYLVQIKKSKEKWSFESLSVFVFFILSVLCRIVFRKASVRYDGYLIPALILVIPFVEIKKVRLFAVSTAVFMAIFIIILSIAEHKPFLERSVPLDEVDTYVIYHTVPTDMIWAWTPSDYLYYKTRRKMGTSVYDPHENLDYGFVWEKNNYREIDVLWKKFLSELDLNRPKLIIDSSGGFTTGDTFVRKGPHREFMNKFLGFVKTNYQTAAVVDGTVIWERKQK
jgi:hypothetical protein